MFGEIFVWSIIVFIILFYFVIQNDGVKNREERCFRMGKTFKALETKTKQPRFIFSSNELLMNDLGQGISLARKIKVHSFGEDELIIGLKDVKVF